MTPNLNQRSAARILDLADPALRPRRPRAIAASALFLVISAFCAHRVTSRGSPASAQAAAMYPANARIAHEESRDMKHWMARVSVAAAVAMGSSAVAQDAVQWRVEDGGNGHWYALVLVPKGVSWPAARDHAASIGGYLATPTSASEDAFLRSVAADAAAWTPGEIGPWLGGYQNPASSTFAEPGAGWQWTSDEPWSWAQWTNAGTSEPNNCHCSCGDENHLHYKGTCCAVENMVWNDFNGSGTSSCPSPISMLIEWSADCNADGIVDYGQILAGELEDTNANNIPDCCEDGRSCACEAADISGNGTVDAVDLAAVLNSWGNAPTGKTRADVDRDGIVDAIDLAEVLGAWGVCP